MNNNISPVVLNECLVVTPPDGFHVMTEEERHGMTLLEDGPWVGLSDPDRHILVTMGWKQVNKLAAKMLSGRNLAENMEKQVRRAMAALGYQPDGFRERQIAGTSAHGFGYEYTAQQIDMSAESYVLKMDATLYYFHFYARSERKEESLVVWNSLLESIREC